MVIIDTHVLIWLLYDRNKLSERAMRTMREAEVCVSIASLWELSIKRSKGMIDLPHSIPQIANRCLEMGIEILGITPEHCQGIQKLPFFHKDPFDRMIVAQAIEEEMVLITCDEKIQLGYPMVTWLW